MPIAVPYEEEILLGAGEDTAGPQPEAEVATTANPTAFTTIESSPAPSAVMTGWAAQRKVLEDTVQRAEADLRRHTGELDWDRFVASDRCRRILDDICYQGLFSADTALAKHWGLGWFVDKSITKATIRAFREKLRVEVLFPSIKNPTNSTLLDCCGVAFVGGKCQPARQTFTGLMANDPRFPYAKPLVVLSWNMVSPWSVLSPDTKNYHQMVGFTYTDTVGKVWDTGQVLSQHFRARMTVPSVEDGLAELEAACGRLFDYGSHQNYLRRCQARLKTHNNKMDLWSKIALPEQQLEELTRQGEMFEKGDRAAPRGLLLTGTPGTGKTMIASTLARSITGNFQQLSLADLKQQQLGASGQKVREVWNIARKNQPSVLFIDECEGVLGKRGAAETDVISADIVQAFLAEWDRGGPSERVWVIGATNRRDMLDDAILSRFGSQIEIALPGLHERQRIFRHEMEEVFPGALVPEDMAALTQGMSGRDLRNLAAQVRSAAYPGAPTVAHYHAAVQANRKSQNTKVNSTATWDTLVLDDAVLQRLKLSCALLRDAETWKAQGIDVPGSMLLSGPSGTGKTQIARTLANESGLSFLAATTADVKANFLGQSGNRVKQLFERARTKAPVILFLDELDIIAPDRAGAHDALTDEIVGQLLQELDGIVSHDSKVFLLAATNHVNQVDRAVLSRFQEKITVPLPDQAARTRLLMILLGKKKLGFSLEAGSLTLSSLTESRNMSGRDLQSWVGRAEHKALQRAINAGGPEHFSLLLEDFD